jgi:hypothetical protein
LYNYILTWLLFPLIHLDIFHSSQMSCPFYGVIMKHILWIIRCFIRCFVRIIIIP